MRLGIIGFMIPAAIGSMNSEVTISMILAVAENTKSEVTVYTTLTEAG
jgi:hypothetical protein